MSELRNQKILSLLKEYRVKPELYIDGNEAENLKPEDVVELERNLSASDLLPITLHAPFVDLSPGSPDETIRNISLNKIVSALDVAEFIPVKSIVVHSGYNDWFFDFKPEKWLKNAVKTFSAICEKASSLGAEVYVENIFERSPETLLALLGEIGWENLKICFDAGHANLFSSIPLVDWVDRLGSTISEVHIHDNTGLRDEHLPVTEGAINFRGILWALKERNLKPTFTLEPHTLEHARRTLHAFRKLAEEVFSPVFQDIF